VLLLLRLRPRTYCLGVTKRVALCWRCPCSGAVSHTGAVPWDEGLARGFDAGCTAGGKPKRRVPQSQRQQLAQALEFADTCLKLPLAQQIAYVSNAGRLEDTSSVSSAHSGDDDASVDDSVDRTAEAETTPQGQGKRFRHGADEPSGSGTASSSKAIVHTAGTGRCYGTGGGGGGGGGM